MADLVQEFFQRDLSESEHEALSRLLEQSPEAALNYQNLLEKNYLATGLPQPTLPKGLQSLRPVGGNGLTGGSGFIKVLLIGLAATSIALLKFWPRPHVDIPTTVQQVPAKPALPSVLHKVKSFLPFKPVAAVPGQEGQE